MNKNFQEINHHLWNEWTSLNLEEHSSYQAQIAQFSDGLSTLPEVVLAEVGSVTGKSLIHLMCHFGLDTFSWARQGARVTGVDYAEGAIAKARELSQSFSIPAEFICADIYALKPSPLQQYDIVFTSVGVLIWLPDLKKWAEIAAHLLKPGGVFYLYDGHPLRQFFITGRADAHGKIVKVGYFGQPEPDCYHEQGSYANPTAPTTHQVCYWPHALGEIVTALCESGLQIEYLHEFPKVIEKGQLLIRDAAGQYEVIPEDNLTIPNTFSIRAKKI